jgi:hypothetical protein
MLESYVEKKIVDYAKTLGYLSIKFPARYIRGFPDRLFINACGVTIYLEIKKPGAKPTMKQLQMIEQLKAQRCAVFWVDNIEDGKEILTNYRGFLGSSN